MPIKDLILASLGTILVLKTFFIHKSQSERFGMGWGGKPNGNVFEFLLYSTNLFLLALFLSSLNDLFGLDQFT